MDLTERIASGQDGHFSLLVLELHLIVHMFEVAHPGPNGREEGDVSRLSPSESQSTLYQSHPGRGVAV